MSDEENDIPPPFDPLAAPPVQENDQQQPELTESADTHPGYFEDDGSEDTKTDAADKEPIDKETIEKLLARVKNTVKGNGFPPDKITVDELDGEILSFHAVQILEFITETAEKQVNGKERGEKAGSRQDMQNKIRSHVEKITRDREVRQQALTIMRKQNDLGFFRDGIVLNLDKFGKQFVVHEPCHICETRGQVKCQVCHGKREILCQHCNGTREMQCTQCQGRQFMETAQGRMQCNMCHGKGRMGCRMCQQTGRAKCHICRGIGTSPCKQCGSTGWHSHMAVLRIKAKGHFEYNHTELPEEAIAIIEQYGPELVTEEHVIVRIEEEQHKLEEHSKRVKENEIAIPYEVKLPWGDITLNFGKNPIKGNLFGFQGLFLNSEPYIEKIIAKGLEKLHEAANTISNVGNKIAAATKYRFIAEVYMISGRMPAQKAFAMLRNKYPSGITDDTLKAMIIKTDKSLKQLTDKPRKIGMLTGLGISAALLGIYFFIFRGDIAAELPSPQISIITDIIMLAIAMACTIMCIRFRASKTVKKAFKHLAKAKDKMPVKAGNTATIGIIGVIVIFIVMLGISIVAGIEPPFYLQGILTPPE